MHNQPHTLETRQKISESVSKSENAGRPTGILVSEETRQRMSQAKISAPKLGHYRSKNAFSEIFPESKMTYGQGYNAVIDGKKIYIKGSTLLKKTNDWRFGIRKNKRCDIFALIAFDNPTDSNVVHLWMVPAHLISDKAMIAISEGSKAKFAEYKVDLEK